jgi:predicted nucleic acid-binding protein
LERASTGLNAKTSLLVLDSSAIISIFFRERFENEIVRIVEGQSHFATMDISYAEVGSAAWKSVAIFKQSIEPVREALSQATTFISDNCDVVSSKGVAAEAFELGTKYKIQIYDCLFLCLARKLDAQLLTTDERLYNKVDQIRELRGTVFPMNFEQS